MADELPTASEFFSKDLPTGEEFFGRPARISPGLGGGVFIPANGDDDYWSQTRAGRVLREFGVGFGGHEIGLSTDDIKMMREKGYFNDYSKGQGNLSKALLEGVYRPSAFAFDTFIRGLSGGFRAVQQTAVEAGGELERLGVPKAESVSRELVAGGLEAFQAGKFTGLPSRIKPPDMNAAKDLKIIGATDAEWRGAKDSEIERVFRDAGPEVGASEIEKVLAAKPADASDVHSVARGIAPDLFYRYDEIQAKRDKLSSDARELSEMRARDAAQAQEIEALRAKVQEQLRATESQTREMAPAVKEAYAEAKKAAPDESGAPVRPVEPAAAEIAPAAMPESRSPVRPIEAQRAFIQQDVADKLVAAGRSEAEAQAAAAIDAAYWETRAARFKGAKGTAEEMYRREAPEILGPGMQSDFRSTAKPRVQRLSLGQFVSSVGIIDNDPLIGDIKSITGGGRKYIRKDGVPLDRLREMAAEQGYIPHDSTPSTLLDALTREDKGHKVYKPGEEHGAEFNRDTHINAIETALDDGLREVGIDPKDVSPEVRARTIELVDKGESDVISAYEKAESEAGMFQTGDAPTFYSAVERAVSSAKQEKAPADQWLGTLRNTAGVKPEEMQWLGLEGWLKSQKGAVSKSAVQDYIRANAIEVKEVEKGKWGEAPDGEPLAPGRDAETKFSQYTLPGGENYRELLLTLPPKESTFNALTFDAIAKRLGYRGWTSSLTEAQKAHVERVYDAQTMKPTELSQRMTEIEDRLADRSLSTDEKAALRQEYKDLADITREQPTFKSSHFDEPNILAHVRFNDRVIDGKKTLFIEEVQSDWHQAGKRKGYEGNDIPAEKRSALEAEKNKLAGEVADIEETVRAEAKARGLEHSAWMEYQDENLYRNPEYRTRMDRITAINYEIHPRAGMVPDAPFKTTWPELSMKRMIRYAAENGYDKVAWTPGEVQAARYDLSKQVSRLYFQKNTDGTFDLHGETPGRGDAMMLGNAIPETKLPDYVGKDIADKIVKRIADNPKAEPTGSLEGVDLKVGGEGMLGFYDDILPSAVNKLVKKYGSRVKNESLETVRSGDEGAGVDRGENNLLPARELQTQKTNVHALDITPDLKDAALEKGFPLFQGADSIKRGRIRLREDGRNTITLLKDANASTFIHEKGHDYLHRMIRDAVDEAAPADLKADAQTVFKWLGVEKGADIKTRHHEKFARGFENYIMEGRAPSQGLARVFEQFRQWLVRIYTEASRLKAPINDEVRAVFDRMLAVEPEKTVIAPDRMPAEAAAKAEASAASALPANADAAASTIQAESATVEARLPEAQRARLAEIAAGLEDRAGATARTDNYGNAPGAPATGDGSGQRAGADQARGGQASPEGDSASARPASPRLADIESPNALLPPPESKFIDKAGNIRLDNLNTPEDVNVLLRQAADEHEGFITARRGVLSDAEVGGLADALGMDAKTLDRRKIGEAFNAEQIVAARKLLVKSAVETRDAMAKAATGDEAAVMAYAEAKARHLMIQDRVSGITAEAGRALRAFRAIEGMDQATATSNFLKSSILKDATGKTLFQLQREAQLGMQLDTPQKVSKFIHDSNKPTWKDKVIEVWINSLLSGTGTHVTNMIGNTITALMVVPETAIASVVGTAAKAVGREQGVHMGEAGSRLFSIVQGAKEGIRAGWEIVKNEDAIVNEKTQIEQRRPRAIGGVTGKVVRAPGRMLAAEDQVFRGIAFRQEIAAQAYRTAANENLNGHAFSARVADLMQNPTEAMTKAAEDNASYQTYQKKMGQVGNALSMLSNSHPAAKLVMPFVKTPTNLLKYANERSLFGLFSQEVRNNILGRNGAAARDTQAARIAMGTALSTWAVSAALDGTITGGGPTDPAEKALKMQDGWRPYSVRIGNSYYSYGSLEPFSTLLGVAADMAEVAKASTKDENENIGKMIFASVVKNLKDKTSLRGPSDLIQATSDPDRYGEKYLQRLVGTIVPTGVADVAKSQDPYLREARTTIDGIKARLPGMSQDLFPRRDVWGEPMEHNKALGPSRIYVSRIKNDPVNQALEQLEMAPGKLKREIKGVELTEQQYDDYARLAGRTAKMRLDAVVNQPGFDSLPPFVRRKIMDKTVDHAREEAAKVIQMQYPEIIQQALENKRELLTAK